MRADKAIGQTQKPDVLIPERTMKDGTKVMGAGKSFSDGHSELVLALSHASLKEGSNEEARISMGKTLEKTLNSGTAATTMIENRSTIPVGTRENELMINQRDANKALTEYYNRYRKYGLIRAAALLMGDFTMTGLRLVVDESQDKTGEDQKVLDAWIKMSGFMSVSNHVSRGVNGVGNAFVVSHYGKIKRETLLRGGLSAEEVSQKRLLRADAMENREIAAYGVDPVYARNVVPIAYEILPPNKINVSGPSYNRVYEVDIGASLAEKLNEMGSKKRDLVSKFQPIMSRVPGKGESKIILDSRSVDHIKFIDSAPYERIGVPFWWQSSYGVIRKEELMEADQVMARSGLQYLVAVTIGNDEYVAGPEEIEAVAQLFMASGASHTVFWNHTLNVSIHQPTLEMFGEQKYAPIIASIMEEMGIPVVLTGGASPGNHAVARVNVKPVIQRINCMHKMLDEEWIMPQINRVAAALGIRGEIRPVWNPNPLDEIERLHNMVQSYLDRQVITRKSAVDFIRSTGLSTDTFDSFLTQMEKENDLIEQGILIPANSPYNSPKEGGAPVTGDPNPENPSDGGDDETRSNRDLEGSEEPGASGSGTAGHMAIGFDDVDALIQNFDLSNLENDCPDSDEEDIFDLYEKACSGLVKAWKAKNPDKRMTKGVRRRISKAVKEMCIK